MLRGSRAGRDRQLAEYRLCPAQAGAEAAWHSVPGVSPSLELALPLGTSPTDLDEGAA